MSTLETLEICFAANLNGVDEQLNLLTARLGGLSTAALSAGLHGQTFAQQFAAGILAGASGAAFAASRLSAAANLTGGTENAVLSGYALSAGFASGIRSGSGIVGAAVSAIVNTATRRIRSLLSIHSPSQVAAGFGEYFGEGFALGIRDTATQVEQAAGALSGAAMSGLSALPQPAAASGTGRQAQSGADAVPENLHFTIPLMVDGIKLGEASIRGINAVTRSAGRVLLEI